MRDDEEPLDVYQSKQEMLSRSLSLLVSLSLVLANSCKA